MRTPEELVPLIKEELAAARDAEEKRAIELGEALIEARSHFANEKNWRAWLRRTFKGWLSADRAAQYVLDGEVVARRRASREAGTK